MKIKHVLGVLQHSQLNGQEEVTVIAQFLIDALFFEGVSGRDVTTLDPEADVNPKDFFEIANKVMALVAWKELNWKSPAMDRLIEQLGGQVSLHVLSIISKDYRNRFDKFRTSVKAIVLLLNKATLLTHDNWANVIAKYKYADGLFHLISYLSENRLLTQKNFHAVMEGSRATYAMSIAGILDFFSRYPGLNTQNNLNMVLHHAENAYEIYVLLNKDPEKRIPSNQRILDIIFRKPEILTENLLDLIYFLEGNNLLKDLNYEAILNPDVAKSARAIINIIEFLKLQPGLCIPENANKVLQIAQHAKGVSDVLRSDFYRTMPFNQTVIDVVFSRPATIEHDLQSILLLAEVGLFEYYVGLFTLNANIVLSCSKIVALLYKHGIRLPTEMAALLARPDFLHSEFCEIIGLLRKKGFLTQEIFEFIFFYAAFDSEHLITRVKSLLFYLDENKILTADNINTLIKNIYQHKEIGYLLDLGASVSEEITQENWNLVLACLPALKNNTSGVSALYEIALRRFEMWQREKELLAEGAQGLDSAALAKLVQAFQSVIVGLAGVATQEQAGNDEEIQVQANRYLRKSLQTIQQTALAVRLTGDQQNTHTVSVHADVSESLSNLARAFAALVDTPEKRNAIEAELLQWIVPLQHSAEPNVRAAYRGLLRLMRDPISPEHPSVLFRNFRDPLSKVSIAEAIYYFWLTIRYPSVRSDMTQGEWAIQDKEYRALFIEGLYEAQRGRTMGSDGQDFGEGVDYPICEGGTFNKLVEKLKGISPLVVLRVMRPEIAALRMPKVTLAVLASYLDAHYPLRTPAEAAILFQVITALETEGLDDGGPIPELDFWKAISPLVAEEMFKEFGEMYGNNRSNPAFVNLVGAGKYATVASEHLFALKMLASAVAEGSPLALPLRVLYSYNKQLLDEKCYAALCKNKNHAPAISMVLATLGRSGILSKEAVTSVTRNAAELETHGVTAYLSHPGAVLSESRFWHLMERCGMTEEALSPLTPSSTVPYSPYLGFNTGRLRRRYTGGAGSTASPASSAADCRSPRDEELSTPPTTPPVPTKRVRLG